VKIAEVKVGGRYCCTVSGRRTIVRITNIHKTDWLYGRARTRIVAINEATGREVTVKSAAKFVREARPDEKA